MNLLLEGDNLEALLLRASREGGTSARIVRAEKIRRGGVLGFFTKEGFEVAVEIPKSDDQPPEGKTAARKPTARKSAARKSGGQTAGRKPFARSAKGVPADGLLELAERASAAERAAALAVAREAAFQAAMRDVAVFIPELDESDAEAEVDADVEADVEVEAEVQVDVDVQVEPDVQVDVEAEADVDVVAEAQTETQIDLDIEAEMGADAGAEPDSDDEVEIAYTEPATTVEPAGRLTRISFAKAEFPEDRPWPGLAGLSPLLTPAWLKRSSGLNEPDPVTDQPLVTDVPEVSEAAVSSQPILDVSDDAGQPPSPDAQLWFNTSPAREPEGPDFDSPETLEEPQLFEELQAFENPETFESLQAFENPQTLENPPAFENPETLEDHETLENPQASENPQTVAYPQTNDTAQPLRLDYQIEDHEFELSLTGGIGHHLTEIGPLAGTGLPRAATVVPRHRSRRSGINRVNRSLPVPRGASGDESDERPEQHLDQRAVRHEMDGDTLMPDSTDDYFSVQDADDDDNELTQNPSDPPAGLRTSSEAAWRLLRSWRPGVRRRQATTEDDDPGHLREAAQWAPEDIELALDPMTASLAFAEAAIHGTVPAAAAQIESVGQLAADREALASLGIPAAWTDELAEGDRFTSIVAMLSRLAEPTIQDDAAVIAVVGPADMVELEAHRTALDLPTRGRPRAVTLVSGQTGVDRRAAIARSKRIRPVVISIAIEGYDDPAGTRQILDSVKAEAVIAVVDASRPLAEIADWIGALERVDAIALDGALDADRPASVLGLDVPVIRVDGISVDRIGWAALLCAQLAAMESAR